jgi:hypothetical protein
METRRRRVAQNGSKAPSIHRRYRIPVSDPKVTRALKQAVKDRPQWQKDVQPGKVQKPSRVWPWSTPTGLNKERALLGLSPKASQLARVGKTLAKGVGRTGLAGVAQALLSIPSSERQGRLPKGRKSPKKPLRSRQYNPRRGPQR